MEHQIVQCGPVFRGRRVKAVYSPPENPAHAGNPFIEALHPILSEEKSASLMRRLPAYDPAMRMLPAIERINYVTSISNYIEPLPAFIDLEQRISRMIRNGYYCRNPLSREFVKNLNTGFHGLDFARGGSEYYPVIRSSTTGFNLAGASGSGKTTAIESVLSLHDQVIVHNEFNGIPFDHQQLVWIKIECPFDGSVKGLCLAFFAAVDGVLGTNYSRTLGNPRKAANQMLGPMAQIAYLHGLGTLVIDEIQRLGYAASGGHKEMLNFFVQLTNSIGVPVVLVGTLKALSLFCTDFAQARRSAGQGDMVWTRMAEGEEWRYFVEGLWRYQWTRTPTPLSDDLAQAMYEESQGIIDIAIKLYMLVQWEVIGGAVETIKASAIRDVARKKLNMVRPLLKALRYGTAENLKGLDDVLPDRALMQAYKMESREKNSLGKTIDALKEQRIAYLSNIETKNQLTANILLILLEAGFARETAEECARMACDRHAAENDSAAAIRTAMRIALSAEQGLDSKAPRKRGKSTPPSQGSKDDLRAIVQGAGKDVAPHEALCASGDIVGVTEFLEGTL